MSFGEVIRMNHDDEEYFVVFFSHNHTTLFYKRMKEKQCDVELMSTPCTISAGCSQCIKFKEKDLNAIKEEIKNSNIRIRALYKIENNKERSYYVQLYKRT